MMNLLMRNLLRKDFVRLEEEGSAKFCLLLTVALDIFIKEKNNTLYLPWISPLLFFYAKDVYSVKLSGKVPY